MNRRFPSFLSAPFQSVYQYKAFDIIFGSFTWNKTNFHMNGFAPGLALKQRQKATLAFVIRHGRNTTLIWNRPEVWSQSNPSEITGLFLDSRLSTFWSNGNVGRNNQRKPTECHITEQDLRWQSWSRALPRWSQRGEVLVSSGGNSVHGQTTISADRLQGESRHETGKLAKKTVNVISMIWVGKVMTDL